MRAKSVLSMLLTETIPIRFCLLLTCRKQKSVQSKTLHQGLVLLTPGFLQFRQVSVD